MLRLAGSGFLLTRVEFQTATEQCRKRLKTCINAEGGHSEHLLWHCLPDIPVATHHMWFFSEPSRTTTTGSFQSLQRLKERNKPSVRWKSIAIHKLVWRHFQVGWAGGLHFVLFWDQRSGQLGMRPRPESDSEAQKFFSRPRPQCMRPRPDTVENNSVCMSMKTKILAFRK